MDPGELGRAPGEVLQARRPAGSETNYTRTASPSTLTDLQAAPRFLQGNADRSLLARDGCTGNPRDCIGSATFSGGLLKTHTASLVQKREWPICLRSPPRVCRLLPGNVWSE